MDRLHRQRTAATMVHQEVEAQTQDHRDHTFAGVMFDVRSTAALPFEYLEISSIWVRGGLGPISVWSTTEGFHAKRECEEEWTKHYQGMHGRSYQRLQPMYLQTPIRINPNTTMGIYVHSACLGDEQLVYANQRNKVSHSDMFLDILPGVAHLSDVPFSDTHSNWGGWGSPWRERREFVGRVSYGIRWLRWNLDTHTMLPPMLRRMAWAVMMSRHPRARNSLLYWLDDDHIFYILNNIDWWDMPCIQNDLKDVHGKAERQRERIKKLEGSKRELTSLKKEIRQMRLVVSVFDFQLEREFQQLAQLTTDMASGAIGGGGGAAGAADTTERNGGLTEDDYRRYVPRTYWNAGGAGAGSSDESLDDDYDDDQDSWGNAYEDESQEEAGEAEDDDQDEGWSEAAAQDAESEIGSRAPTQVLDFGTYGQCFFG